MGTTMDADFDHAPDDLWVFGYGSLIWRPGFEYLERAPARMIGLHRSLCVYSFVHRGTPERPGLVLGIDQGGACRGVAYRVAAAKRADTLAYLRAREQVTAVYRETDAHGLARRQARSGASKRSATRSTAAIRNTPAGSRWSSNFTMCARATAARATTATM